MGGLSVLLDSPLAEGSTLAITLILTQDGIEDPDEEPFSAKASVMWAAPTDSGQHLLGLRFAALPPSARTTLERFLAACSEG